MSLGIIYVRALYDYEADNTTSISFHKGDVIQVIEQLDSGWWYGILSGVRGWFPGNYCQITTGPEDFADQIQNRHFDQDVSEGEDGAVYDERFEHQDHESEGDAQGALPTALYQGDALQAVQGTRLSHSPPSVMIPHESSRKEEAKQDDHKGAGDPPALQDLPEMVRDFRLETETVFETTVHVMHGIHGRRRQAWKWEQVLGWGGGGFVRLQSCVNGPDEGQNLRAVKCLQLRDSSKFFHYSRELETLIKFSHLKYSDFFVRCYGWFSEKDRLYIALEYLPFGDLNEHLEKTTLSGAEAKQVVRQVATALRFMHDAGFAHRDLKPKNILIKARPPQDWWVKLSDFGLSKRVEAEHESSVLMGTYAYAAPELLSHPGRNGSSADCSSALNWPAADIWSLGQLVCRVVTGPLAVEDDELRKYSRGKREFPSNMFSESEDSLQLADFVSSTMRVDPERRLTIGGALHHSWLRPESHQMATGFNSFCTDASPTTLVIHPWDTTEFGNGTADATHEIRPWDTTELRNGTADTTQNIDPGCTTELQDEAADTTQNINPGFTTESQNETATTRPQRVLETVQLPATTVGECADIVSPPSSMVPADPENVQLSPELPCELYYIYGRTGGSEPDELNNFAKLNIEPVRSDSPLLVHGNASAELGKKWRSNYRYTLSIIQAAENDENITVRPPELARLKIGKGPITALAFSSNSSRLAVACAKSLQLWATNPPAYIGDAQVPQGDLKNVRFSPDSKWICGSVDKLALLFDSTSGLRVTVLDKHSAAIQSLAFTHDSQRLFSVCEDGNVRVSCFQRDPKYRTENQCRLGGWLDFQSTPILSWLQQCPLDNKEYHITMCQNGRMFEWDAHSIHRRPSYTGRKLDWYNNEAKLPRTIYQATISPNKKIIALLHSEGLTLLPGDRKVAAWDETPDHARGKRFSRNDQVQAIEFLADSSILSIAFHNGLIELWNVLSGRTISKFRNGSTQSSCMATSLNSYCLATVSNSVDVVLRDTEACKTMDEVLSHIGSAAFIASSHDNTLLLSIPGSTTTKETFCLWNVKKANLGHVLPAPPGGPTLLARFSHNSKQLLHLSIDCVLSTLDISTGRLLKAQPLYNKELISRSMANRRVFRPDSNPYSGNLTCWAADMSPDLSVVAVMVALEDQDNNCAICLWDAGSGQQIGFFGWDPISQERSSSQASYPRITDLSILELTFSSDGKQLAAMFGTWLSVYDTNTGAKLSELCLKPSPHWLLPAEVDAGYSGGTPGTVTSIAPYDKRKTRAYLNPFKQRLDFSPDGHELSILTRSNKLSVWSLETTRVDSGSPHRRFFPPTSTYSGGEFIYPAMSPNWKFRALPTHNGTLFVYSRENVLLRTLPMPKGTMKFLGFSPDSRLLVAMSAIQFTVWHITRNDMWQALHDGEAFMNKEDVASMYVSSSPATLFAATSNSLVCIWDLGTGTCIKQVQGST